MKIYYGSDLHLEFGMLEKPLPKGDADDVLLLAGDTVAVRALDPVYTDARGRSIRKAVAYLNEEIAEKFPGRAFATLGNHESYGSVYEEAAEALQRGLPAAKVLDCDHVKLRDDVILFGAPLWTSMGNGNPLTMLAIRNGMNDFKEIKTRLGTNFTPEIAVEEHVRALRYLSTLAEENRDKKIVVMTHHAPSRQGAGGDGSGGALDHAYYTDLNGFIEGHPNIKWWVHGHSHIRRTYLVEHCAVYANCRGYWGYEPESRTFDPTTHFEV